MSQPNVARLHSLFDGLFQDFRNALRSLRRDRAFAFTAIAMLALGIGLNVAALTLMSTMLFRGYPHVEQNDRLVYIQEPDALECCVSYAHFLDWRRQAASFDGMAFTDGETVTLNDGNGGRERISARQVSADTFRLLGVQPALGRDFTAEDATPGATPVAILSHRFWERRFGRSADVVGRTLSVDGAPLTVVGVMPEGFSFPEHEDLWVPMPDALGATGRARSGFLVVARLKDGVTVAGAQAELEALSRELADTYPEPERGVTPELQTHAEFFFGNDVKVLYGSIWAATWFVLLIACANLANLSLARTLGRAHEFSTRLALGAGHWRLSRQCLIENLLLASAGGACAWWLANWSIGIYAAATYSVHYVLDYSLGAGTLAYLVAIAAAAGILITLVPVLNLWRINLSATLAGAARGAVRAVSGKQAALIVAQMALAIVLLSGSGVLIRSFMKFQSAQLGIEPQNVLAALIELPAGEYAGIDAQRAFMNDLDARLEALPGVELATTTSHRPAAGALRRAFELEGRPVEDGDEPRPTVEMVRTGVDFFRVVGAAVYAGRDFNDFDVASGRAVAIVNQRFAAVHWPNEDAVGKRLRLYDADGAGEWVTVVGVVSNIVQTDPTRQSYEPIVYMPHAELPVPLVWTLVKTAVPPPAVAQAVRQEIRRVDRDLFLRNFSPLEDMLAFSSELMDVEHQHLGKNAVLFPIFAATALLLAAVGLYAIVAHSVGSRAREIGVRMAIGATTSHIWRLVFGQGMAPVAVGLIAGLGASLAVNRLLQSQLIGVAFYDPVTMAVAPVVLILVALAACRIPAGRAMRVDPAGALRQD